MQQTATIVFPHQLFQNHPALQQGAKVFLVEETLFFNQLNFHKQKLVLHRAGMQFYKHWLTEKRFDITYIEAHEPSADVRLLISSLHKQNITEIKVADVCDDWLRKRLTSACKKLNITLTVFETPYFITTMNDAKQFFDGKKTFFQTEFYIWQRKRNRILVDEKNQPSGGKWSFDYENRKRFPKNETPPALHITKQNNFVTEARTYVEKYFNNNYGLNEAPFSNTKGFFPTTFTEADAWLDDFIQHRFQQFGVYEDAIVEREQVLHHSVLSSSLNTGLLTPKQVVDAVIAASHQYKIPINSLEGFVRQVIGWREFIYVVYELAGNKERTRNYWGFSRKIPASFWQGTTGIAPVDAVIKKVLQCGYTHHIERLMILGNFMLLCEFDPHEVYKWFMELFIDAYDWVMVPNVYGMTQFADGGMMSTKPYISSSNYIMKMSDFKKGTWQQVWDALFWRFMHVHRDFFPHPRIGMLLTTFDKMPAEKRDNYVDVAEKFLHSLDEETQAALQKGKKQA